MYIYEEFVTTWCGKTCVYIEYVRIIFIDIISKDTFIKLKV